MVDAQLPPATQPSRLNPPAIVQQINELDTSISPAFRRGYDAVKEIQHSLGQKFDLLQAFAFPPAARNIAGPQPGDPLRMIPQDQPDTAYDGALVGKDGAAFKGLAYWEVPPVMPAEKKADDILILVNGMTTDLRKHAREMQKLADASGCAVIGVHNATEGFERDAAQAANDEFDRGDNAAVNQLHAMIGEALRTQRPITIAAQSQGAAITSRAIAAAKRDLTARGMTEEQAQKELRHISVETYGGAAWMYPDGPAYTHFINTRDPVAFDFGLGRYGLSDRAIQEAHAKLPMAEWIAALELQLKATHITPHLIPGKDAKIVRFTQDGQKWWETHIIEVYLAHRGDEVAQR